MKKYAATMVILNNKETVGLLPELMSELVKKLIPARMGETVLPWTIEIKGEPFPEVDGIRFTGTIKTEERLLTQEEMIKLAAETLEYIRLNFTAPEGSPGNDAG